MVRDSWSAAAVVAVVLVLFATVPAATLAPAPGPGARSPSSDLSLPAAITEHAAVRALHPPQQVPPTSPPPPVVRLPSVLTSIGVTAFANATSVGIAPFNVTFLLNLTTTPLVSTQVAYTINWTFGDGTPLLTTYAQNSTTNSNASTLVRHLYQTLGEFNASVYVTNNLNSKPITSHKNVVFSEAPVSVSWRSTVTPLDLGKNFNAAASVTGGRGPYSAVWLATPSGCAGSVAVGVQVFLNCTPAAIGTYFAHLQVTDGHGVRTNSWQNFTIKTALTVRLSYQSWFFCNGTHGTYQANLTAYTTAGVTPYIWEWNFGDGTPNSNQSSIGHRFAIGPTYVVTALVNDSGEGSVAASINVSTAYPACTSNTSISYTPPVVLLQGGIFLLVIALVVLGLLLVRRRPSPPATAPVSSWQPGPSTSDPAGLEEPPSTPPPGASQ